MKKTMPILLLAALLILSSCAEVNMSPRMQQLTEASAVNVRAMSDEFNPRRQL